MPHRSGFLRTIQFLRDGIERNALWTCQAMCLARAVVECSHPGSVAARCALGRLLYRWFNYGFCGDALDQSSATLLSVLRAGTLARRFNRGGYPSKASACHWRFQHSTQCRGPGSLGPRTSTRMQTEGSLLSPLPLDGGRGWQGGLSGAHLFYCIVAWVPPIARATLWTTP